MKRKASQQLKSSRYEPKPKYRAAMGRPAPRRKSQAVGLAAEKKFNDVSFNTDATTTGTIVALNTFGAGDTALLRDGNKILCKTLYIKCALALEDIAQSAIIRFMLVVDKNANVAAPTIAGVATGPLESIAIQSQRQISSMARFHVLMDEVVTLNQSGGTGCAKSKAYFERFVKIPENLQLTTYFDGTSSLPVTNGLSLIYFSDVAAGAADVDVLGTVRLRFIG
uniref:hypothetical protein n=1 Tax=Flavobacterium sp. TaxID=239 RepID=UPI0040489F37